MPPSSASRDREASATVRVDHSLSNGPRRVISPRLAVDFFCILAVGSDWTMEGIGRKGNHSRTNTHG